MSDVDKMVNLMEHAAELLEEAQPLTSSPPVHAAMAYARAILLMVAASVTPATCGVCGEGRTS